MPADTRREGKIVRILAKFLANEQQLIGRWRMVGNAAIVLGSLLWAVAILAYAQDASPAWGVAALAGVGGLCLGLGLWFSTLVTQWPVVRQFIDAEKVRQRIVEIDGRGKD
jgi:hypothetical protein